MRAKLISNPSCGNEFSDNGIWGKENGRRKLRKFMKILWWLRKMRGMSKRLESDALGWDGRDIMYEKMPVNQPRNWGCQCSATNASVILWMGGQECTVLNMNVKHEKCGWSGATPGKEIPNEVLQVAYLRCIECQVHTSANAGPDVWLLLSCWWGCKCGCHVSCFVLDADVDTDVWS